MAERWFFALWPDAAAREGLVHGSLGIVPPGARPTHPRDLHLTLIFLGELAPGRLAAAVEAADRLRAAPPTLCIDRAGYFPRSRVLWCAPDRPPGELGTLHDGLERGLARSGIPCERRPYRPHITLARRVGRAPAPAWGCPVAWTARELVLARGLDGQVPRYLSWRRWLLAAAPSAAGPECTGCDYDGPGRLVR